MSVEIPSSRRAVAPVAVLLVASFGAFLAFLDGTIVNVAFPSIQAAFPRTSFDALSWVLNAYNIVFAAFLVAAGRLADLLGRRRMFVLGVTIFTLASAGCALAGGVEELVGFRIVQAVGAAVLVPASLGLVVEAFPPERRAHGIGLWGASAALAAGLGPPIGGALMQADSWRLAFLVNVPLGVAAVVFARRQLVESRAPGVRVVPDLRGAALLGLALAALTLGVVKGPDWGWAGLPVIVAFVVSALATAGLVVSSRRHPSPILDPELLRERGFAVASLVTIVASMGFYAYLLTHILWLHYVWGYSLLRSGLAVAPGALVAAVVAGALGRYADAKGYRRIAVPGALIWAGGFAWYIFVVGTHPDFLGQWLPGQLISGVGVGATLPILASAAMAAVPGGRYAAASAVVSSARQVGAVLGIALLVVIVGTPTAGTAATVFRHGWVFCAICFLVTAAGAAPIGRPHPRAVGLPVESWSGPAHAFPGAAGEPASDPSAIGGSRRGARRPRPGRPVPAGWVRPEPGAPAADGPLSDVALLAALPAAVRARIEAAADRVLVLGGDYLFHAGEPADSLYLVRTGRMEVLRAGAVVGELGQGATFGELGLLTGAPRAASVRAKRDSHLLRIGAELFAEIGSAEPTLMHAVATTVAGWLQSERPAETGGRPAVIVVVGAERGAPYAAVADHLVDGLARHLEVVAPGRVDAGGLERAERAGERVVLLLDADDEPQWRSFCLRQADRLVYVTGRPEAPPPVSADRTCDVVMVGPGAPPATAVRAWQESVQPRQILSVRLAERELTGGLRPLVARLAGRSVGLVLCGGGARALAHIGVFDELQRRGLVVDRVAGTSFGAVLAAIFATGRTADEIDAIVYEGLVRRNPLNDYTVPVRAFTRGRKLERALDGFFGDALIESLPRQFRCVSVDLLTRDPVVHREGSLARAVAASTRLPGLFPPLVMNGGLHIDGSVLDNLPVGVLADDAEGPVIAVNVSTSSAPLAGTAAPTSVRVPPLADTLMRSMLLTASKASGPALTRADLVITPSARGVGLLEFHQLDVMRAAGQEAAASALEGFRWPAGRSGRVGHSTVPAA